MRRDDPAQARITELAVERASGQAMLRIERFAHYRDGAWTQGNDPIPLASAGHERP